MLIHLFRIRGTKAEIFQDMRYESSSVKNFGDIHSIFAKLRHIVPKQCSLTLYDSLVTSKISYGLEAYGTTHAKLLNELQVLQNRILKIIHFKDRKYATNCLHKELDIVKIRDLYRIKILKLMHQVHFSRKSLPAVFQNYFQTNKSFHKYETRGKSDYKIIKSNKKWRNYTIQNIGARMWNNLPPNLKSISKQKNFYKN